MNAIQSIAEYLAEELRKHFGVNEVKLLNCITSLNTINHKTKGDAVVHGVGTYISGTYTIIGTTVVPDNHSHNIIDIYIDNEPKLRLTIDDKIVVSRMRYTGGIDLESGMSTTCVVYDTVAEIEYATPNSIELAITAVLNERTRVPCLRIC